jgi:Ca-activated chloride channel family protein
MDVFIAVDCSASMLAEDLKPNRMSYAKLLLGQLIEKLVGDRIGIITFAGQAAIQCPLTVDTQAAAQLLDALQVGLVQTPGTAVGDAIRASFRGLAAGEQSNRVLILLTDGEDHKSDPIGAAKEAKSKGVTIFPIGIGSAQGEPIPDINENGERLGYKRDQKGDVVLSKLDESSLQEIARITGGSYYRASYSGAEVDAIHQALEQFKQGDQKTKQLNRFENRYQWPLGLGILLFLIALAIPENKTVLNLPSLLKRGTRGVF